MTTDDELTDHLRRIANEVDAPPELVAESARAALATRDLDAELAELLRDSALDAGGVRGDGPRVLSFETPAVGLELEVSVEDGQLSVRGLVIDASGEVSIESATRGDTRAVVADGGWFQVVALPVAPIRVRVRTGAGAVISTGWIAI